mmetsp:Transcript_39205/g.113298  ORF Transcript_39205/g.113298 Transcript_39205/m.113298 type:complete len:241 (-) Transcript_39205:376-1098(-)
MADTRLRKGKYTSSLCRAARARARTRKPPWGALNPASAHRGPRRPRSSSRRRRFRRTIPPFSAAGCRTSRRSPASSSAVRPPPRGARGARPRSPPGRCARRAAVPATSGPPPRGAARGSHARTWWQGPCPHVASRAYTRGCGRDRWWPRPWRARGAPRSSPAPRVLCSATSPASGCASARGCASGSLTDSGGSPCRGERLRRCHRPTALAPSWPSKAGRRAPSPSRPPTVRRCTPRRTCR